MQAYCLECGKVDIKNPIIELNLGRNVATGTCAYCDSRLCKILRADEIPTDLKSKTNTLASLSPEQLKVLSPEQISAIIGSSSIRDRDIAKMKLFVDNLKLESIDGKSKLVYDSNKLEKFKEKLLIYPNERFYIVEYDKLDFNSVAKLFTTSEMINEYPHHIYFQHYIGIEKFTINDDFREIFDIYKNLIFIDSKTKLVFDFIKNRNLVITPNKCDE